MTVAIQYRVTNLITVNTVTTSFVMSAQLTARSVILRCALDVLLNAHHVKNQSVKIVLPNAKNVMKYIVWIV